jgi:predicted unusual protein kinase regulating ubiquinone biosynthesis (AarF/ABC1/UbiB family)
LFIGSNDNKIIDAQNMIRDIKTSILRETDLANEIVNMDSVRKAALDSNSLIKVPVVYKELCTAEVIVMEYVPSVKFTVDRDPNLAYMLMDVFVQQFLQHGIIHGDPHAGNVALSLDRKKIVMYDLGHVIYLEAKMRSQMKILVFEIMTENVDGVIQIMKQMPEIIEIRQEEKMKDYIAKYIQYIKTIDIKVLKTMSPDNGDIPIKFSGKIYEIVRTFGIIEGICIDLDPSFSYEAVFLKYIDILLLDTDFFSYKMESDIKNLMKMFQL